MASGRNHLAASPRQRLAQAVDPRSEPSLANNLEPGCGIGLVPPRLYIEESRSGSTFQGPMARTQREADSLSPSVTSPVLEVIDYVAHPEPSRAIGGLVPARQSRRVRHRLRP